MKSLVFLKEDGKGNIYDENGAEAIDIVDEKPDPYALKQLVNLDSYLKESAKFPANNKHIEQSEEEIGTTMKISAKRLTKYMAYGSGTKELFFQAAALKAGVKESTARAWPKSQLQEEHKQCLIEFYDDDPGAYIQDAVEMLISKFAGLEIKKSRVHGLMRDDSDFHINMKASRAWASRGQMAVVTTPTTKAPTHTIIDAISSVGVINLSIRVPKQQPKIQDGKKRKSPEVASREEGPKGTTAGHYLRFLRETFEEFVKLNTRDIAIWCSQNENLCPSDLYNAWKRRFTLKLLDHGKIHLICDRRLSSKLKYEKSVWESIVKSANLIRETKQTFVDEGVKTLAKAASIASKLVQEVLELDANTPSNEQRKEEGDQEQGDKQENGDKEKELQERDEVEEVCEETTEMNNEQRLHVLAYKKFAGNKITDMDKHICHSSFGDMMPAKQVLLKAVTSLLKKPLLNEFELCAMELSLSSIFNKINPAIEEVLYEQVSNQAGPTSTPLELKGISEVSLGLMEEVIAIKDVDQMLSFIYEKKSQMAKQKKSTKDSELTFYRRFAELLDILFNGTDIKIADGETGSKSSKTAIEINKALFHTSDTSPTYPRKIDLLLKPNEFTTVELSSSEWKKSSVSEAIILKQQTKNLKTNTCILST
ncbi:hypothetical protein G6F57_001535 [Rhizopus arrhizus]|nr:hypothetical protein G6F24_005362 [Rhizopus arrhizus]KAG0916878.1 hypothetical protein G6F33_001990 [Rhizopus arrhizus]KAG0946990.1 hypothetical protein G6F30_003500 [Rhizopus arrhizus]KAG0989532.1 hypothetical protein G6F29_000934 [Rhizopus arrhizus]KAG0999667.1 hypothetical protein G6F28_000786 [Rhizopus arrhizus]